MTDLSGSASSSMAARRVDGAAPDRITAGVALVVSVADVSIDSTVRPEPGTAVVRSLRGSAET